MAGEGDLRALFGLCVVDPGVGCVREYFADDGSPSPLVDVLHSLPARFAAEAIRVVTFDEARGLV